MPLSWCLGVSRSRSSVVFQKELFIWHLKEPPSGGSFLGYRVDLPEPISCFRVGRAEAQSLAGL